MTIGDDGVSNEVESLLRVAADDAAKRPAFSKALLDSEVFILGKMDPPPGPDGHVDAGARVLLSNVELETGAVVAFFTSLEALERFLATAPSFSPSYLRISCRALFEITIGERLVLNLGSDYGKEFLPTEIDSLLHGRDVGVTTLVVERPTSVRVGAPSYVPPEMTELLRRFFTTEPSVFAAHLGWREIEGSQPGYLLVVVKEDADTPLDQFGSVASAALPDGYVMDTVYVSVDRHDHYLSSVPPFYVRDSGNRENKRRRWSGRLR